MARSTRPTPLKFKKVLELGSEALSQVSHLVEVCDLALIDPAEELRGAEFLFSEGGEDAFEFRKS